MNIQVMLCQNDSTGNLTNEVHMIDILLGGEIVSHFETIDLMPRKCVRLADRILEFDNGVVKFSTVSEMVGNVHWNIYEMPAEYALGLIQLLQLSKQWSCTEAWTPIFGKFKDGKTITGVDLELGDIEPIVIDKLQLPLFAS